MIVREHKNETVNIFSSKSDKQFLVITKKSQNSTIFGFCENSVYSIFFSLSLQKLLFLSTLQNLKFSDGVVWVVFKKKALKGLVSSPFFQCSVTVFRFILGNKMFLEDKMTIYINSSN